MEKILWLLILYFGLVGCNKVNYVIFTKEAQHELLLKSVILLDN